MLMCKVALGNMSVNATSSNQSHAPPGYHSVKGNAIEFIVYRGEQVRVKNKQTILVK